MASACNEKRTREWGKEGIRGASERKKELRKAESEVEGCSTGRYKSEKNRLWYME